MHFNPLISGYKQFVWEVERICKQPNSVILHFTHAAEVAIFYTDS